MMARALGLLLGVAGALVAMTIGSRRGSSPPPPPGGEPPADPWPTRADLATGCDPRTIGQPRPGAEAFRDWVLSTRGGVDAGIWRACNVPGVSSDQHKEGRAWDWTIAVPAAADLIAYLLEGDAARARAAGVLYIIHDRRMWRAYEPRGWDAYTGADPHIGHAHFSFTMDGAMGRTSFYRTGDAAPYMKGAPIA